MFKRTLSIMIVVLTSVMSFAQKVDLDREYIKVNYTNLPTQPILDDNFRTYHVSSNNGRVANEIKIHGFEKLNNEGTLSVDINIGSLIIDNVEIKKREKVNKDKEGNVTSTERFYTPIISYTTNGSYKIDNSQGESLSFGLGSSSNSHKGNEYNSYSKAANYWKNNKYSLKGKFRNEFINNSIFQMNKNLNKLYGYEPYTFNDLFWILDSKKNSDYQGHKQALADMKALLSSISHEESLDAVKPGLQPIIDYFLSVVPNYPEDKKKHRKMRYASYYNIGRLYYHFDMPDKAIEFANKVIENDYDKADGKKLIKQSQRLKELFEINKISTRHFPVETVDNSDVVEQTEVAAAPETPKITLKDTYVETVFTNNDGSKIEGTIKISVPSDREINRDLDLTNFFKNSVKIYTLNEEGEAVSKNFFAREGASFEANGATYKAVKFNPAQESESQGNVVSLDGAKYHFARVLIESNKLTLYRYKKELIFKKAGDKKGQSTSSLAYAVGFKKKLAKLVDDCGDLASLAKEGSFANNEESLIAFMQEYKASCAQ